MVDVSTDSSNYECIRIIFVDEAIAAYCVSRTIAEEVYDGLVNALEYLKKNPLLIVSNFQIGIVEATASNGDNRWIAVEVEESVFEVAAPRIMLNIFEDRHTTGFSSTWWFDDEEATQLAGFLLAANVALSQERRENVGYLGGPGADKNKTIPWLTVTVQQNCCIAPNLLGIQLCFDDELVRESENDGILWLMGNNATELSRILSTAVETKANHPPHIYVPPQPQSMVISHFSWE